MFQMIILGDRIIASAPSVLGLYIFGPTDLYNCV